MDQILYHYTDFIALNGILCNRELRLNNVLNMNDAGEMQLFLKGIFHAVRRRLEDAGENEKIRGLKKVVDEQNHNRFEYSAYVACFSTFRDDAAQWERYANRGKGVCLGFRRKVLEKLIGDAVSLQRVYYQDDLDTHPFVEEIYSLVVQSDGLSGDNPNLREKVREAWLNSASFKHPSFSSEHEIRLVLMPFNAKDFDVKPRYHVAKERIKKYYPLDLEAMCARAGVTIEDLVSEIIIGPMSTQSIPILQDYLQDLSLAGLTDKVVYSDCPLQSRI